MNTEIKPDDTIEQDVQSTDVSTEESAAPETNEEESFAALFAASIEEQPKLSRGEYVTGVVVAIASDVVTVDLKGNSEGVIKASEFAEIGEAVPAIGDEISALMVGKGRQGVELSVLQGKRREVMNTVLAAKEAGELVSGTVSKEVKGGFRVDLGGFEAFLPRSEADTGFVNAGELLNQTFDFAIIEVQQRPENIVVSRKQPLAEQEAVVRAAFFENNVLGDKIEGTIKRLTNFGAFVDLGGLDALLHVSDIAWKHIDNPAEMLSVGQKITAEVIKLDAESGKISISMKNLIEDPWVRVADTYEPGMKVTGTVRKLIKVGAIVELEPGVDGLIHRSEMSWTRKDIEPSKVVTEGDVVDVAVLDFDAEKRRLRLSLKEVRENPWQAWMAANPAGSKVTGKIKNISDFGFFVGLSDELDGLVHIGNISWDVSGDEAIKDYQKGQEVECAVIGVDVERGRIALGVKQLTANPFETFIAGSKKGAAVNGKVIEVLPNAYLIEVADGIVARLAQREMPREQAALKIGDEVEAKVTNIDRKRERVELSIRQLLRDEERDSIRDYAKKNKADESPSALALELQRKFLNK
ncbi:MAG TPA: S1 RNA-binding domain-containing protein [Ghiorsea sp.]|nr:S1 RNA-binding domain-containing protein [Ghiorsea sp.]HIP07620.1 S1 RNA-binding domain-containing protein [Mariprofundaceae bacterium]